MFHKRRPSSKGSTGIHLPRSHQAATTPSTEAASAAGLAFRANQNKNDAVLSAAAAATALRSHTAEPTYVGDLQTKRMQRKGSLGSVKSASAATSDPSRSLATGRHSADGLARSPSTGSMSERTLRRSLSPGARHTPSPSTLQNIPPLPALPPHVTNVSMRTRASSVDHLPQVSSPNSGSGRGRAPQRGVSVDRGSRKPTGAAAPAVPRMPHPPEQTSLSQESARRSVNFSRPISPQNTSPTVGTLPRSRHTGWHSSSSAIEEPARESTTRDELAPAFIQLEADKAAGHAMPLEPEIVLGAVLELHEPKTLMSSSDVGGLSSSRWSTATTAIDESPQIPQTSTFTQSQNPLHEQTTILQHNESIRPVAALKVTPPSDTEVPRLQDVTNQDPGSVDPETSILQPITPSVQAAQARDTDNSPSRNAHFDNGLIIADGVRHAPLGRSASPVKSALKHPTLVREGNANVTDPGSSPSAPKRKKSVRISVEVKPGEYEEDPGLQTSRYAPPTPVKSQHTPQTAEKEFDEHLKPRAMLPSFASVRRNKEPDVGRISPLQDLSSSKGTTTPLRSSLLAGKGARREDIESPRNPGSDDDDLSDSTPLVVGSTSSSDLDLLSSPNSIPTSTTLETPQKEQFVIEGESGEQEARPESRSSEYFIPGAFPRAIEETVIKPKAGVDSNRSLTAADNQHPAPISTVCVPLPATDPAQATAPTPTSAAQASNGGDDSDDSLEDSSDDSSVYSDAMEEMEGGFFSLDRIVEEAQEDDVDVAPQSTVESLEGFNNKHESTDTLAIEKRLEEARLNSQPPLQGLSAVELASVAVEVPTIGEKAKKSVSKSHDRASSPSSLATSRWNPLKAKDKRQRDKKPVIKATAPAPAPAAIMSTTRDPSPSFAKPSFAPQPTLGRSNSSDSVSSFRRSRTAPRDHDGKHLMRSSLRGTSGVGGAPGSSTPNAPYSRRPQSPASVAASSPHRKRPSWRDRGDRLSWSQDYSSNVQASPKADKRAAKTNSKSPTRLSSFLRPSKKKNLGNVSWPRGESDGSTSRGFVSRYAEDSDDEVDMAAFDNQRRTSSGGSHSNRTSSLPQVRGISRRGDTDASSTDLDDSDTEGQRRHQQHQLSALEKQKAAGVPIPSLEDVQKAHERRLPLLETTPRHGSSSNNPQLLTASPTIARLNSNSSGLSTSRFASNALNPGSGSLGTTAMGSSNGSNANLASGINGKQRPEQRRWHSLLRSNNNGHRRLTSWGSASVESLRFSAATHVDHDDDQGVMSDSPRSPTGKKNKLRRKVKKDKSLTTPPTANKEWIATTVNTAAVQAQNERHARMNDVLANKHIVPGAAPAPPAWPLASATAVASPRPQTADASALNGTGRRIGMGERRSTAEGMLDNKRLQEQYRGEPNTSAPLVGNNGDGTRNGKDGNGKKEKRFGRWRRLVGMK